MNAASPRLTESNLGIQPVIQAGLRLTREIRADYRRLKLGQPSASPLALAICQALGYSGYAIDSGAYQRSCLIYLRSGSERSLDVMLRAAWRYGADALEGVSRSWYRLLQTSSANKTRRGMAGLVALQQDLFDEAVRLSERRELRYLGPWLFCAPFKMLAASNPAWLKSPAEPMLWQPLGEPVNGRIRKLKKWGYFAGLPKSMLSNKEGGLVPGMATVHVVQAESAALARSLGIPVTVLNSGLYGCSEG